MGVFSGYQIAVELTSYLPLKKKQELRKLITTNDGIVSFIVTKKCKLLVTSNDEEKAKDSFKCQTAFKFNIPVVESRYVFDCVKAGHLMDPDPYVLLGNTKHHLLASGVIAAPQSKKGAAKSKSKTGFVNLNSVKVWNLCDKNSPSFPEDDYKVARSIQLINSDKKLFFVAEIHVASSSANQFKYRIFTHSGVLTPLYQDKEPDADSGKARRYSNSADECLQIYSRICDVQMEAPNSFTKTQEYLGKNIGSKKFQQRQLEVLMSTTGLDKEVRELVEYIWKEAVGELEDIIAIPIKSIKTEQVDKAESILLELKRLLDTDAKRDDEIQKLSDEFNIHLPHILPHRNQVNTKHLISKKQELCQLVRDVISVSEGTNWSQRCPSESKYKALRCHIKHLTADSPAYSDISQHILGSQKGKSDVEVLSVFEISRSVEESVFNEKMDRKSLLFHSSHSHNFVGILSRGLLLPKVIVDDCGGSRTDVGYLGSGIYFADDASTSAKYSKPSKCKGSRLMLINEVALGKCLDLFKHRTELSAAPAEYDSVHGVRATNDIRSDFKDDEYAIYDTNQQRLRYLVEFKVKDDVLKALDLGKKDIVTADESDISADEGDITANEGDMSGKKMANSVELNDVQNISDPLLKLKAGLVSDSSVEIPLTAVHVKARLIDLAAQVIVFQHYVNKSNRPIEAKYVFPLDKAAAVCGFEAFINDKHIVGEVKEKETAHREYREAISQGHGAYLMDQDEETPEVFTVSVGNLPPWCDVMIKITYVSELQMEAENVFFCIPSCVAPWKKSAGLETVTQSELETVKVTENQIETSIQVAIEMPFEIKEVNCTTHRIRIKKTDTKAVVEMQKNQPIDEGFQLLISLAEIHVPRMWVEQLPDDPDNRACMLTFYPEFEATSSDNYEVIFLLDLSNSMKGNSLTEAKKILLLSLHHLPESCFFNVIVFGTDFVELFPCSRVKNPANVQLAEKFVKSQDATMNNTDVIRLLSSLYLLCPDDGFRNLFLVSDGHISDEKVTLEAARLSCRHSRLFTFGVGSIANHHVLRSLATAGCGYYEFFNSKMKSRWERKVRNQLSKAAQPSLSSIEVNWHNFNNMESPVQAPAEIMALFNGCRQVVYGFVPDCTQATLKAVIDNQEVSTMVSTADLNITTGKILHQLTARAIIQDWTDGVLAAERIEHEIVKKNRKDYIIKLSKDFSIITQFTSFVAIEKREEGEVMSVSKNFNELVQKDSMDILDYMKWEDVKFRICVRTSDQQDLILDVDPNETFGQLKSKVSEMTSKSFALYHSQGGLPVVEEDCLWDHQMEKEAIVYAQEGEDTSHESERFAKYKKKLRSSSFSDCEDDEYYTETCARIDSESEETTEDDSCASDDERSRSLTGKDEDGFHVEKKLFSIDSSSARHVSDQRLLFSAPISSKRLSGRRMFQLDSHENTKVELEKGEEREDEDMGFGLFDDDDEDCSDDEDCFEDCSCSLSSPPPFSANLPSALESFDARQLQDQELPTERQQSRVTNLSEFDSKNVDKILCRDTKLEQLSLRGPETPIFAKRQLYSDERPSSAADLEQDFDEAGYLHSDPNFVDLKDIVVQPESSAVAMDYAVSTRLDEIQRNEVSSLEHSVSSRKAELELKKKKIEAMRESRKRSCYAKAAPAAYLEMDNTVQLDVEPVEISSSAEKAAGGVLSFGAGFEFGESNSVKDEPPLFVSQQMVRAKAPSPPTESLFQSSSEFLFGSAKSVSDPPQELAQGQTLFGKKSACKASSSGGAFKLGASLPVDATLQPAPGMMFPAVPATATELMPLSGSPFSCGLGFSGPAPVTTALFGMERAAVAPSVGFGAGFVPMGSTSQPMHFQASASLFGFASKPTESTSFIGDATLQPASIQLPQAFALPPKSLYSSSLESGFMSAGFSLTSGMPRQPTPVQTALFGMKETIEPPSFGGFVASSSTGSAAPSQPVQTIQEPASAPMPSFKSKVASASFSAIGHTPPPPPQACCFLPPPPPPPAPPCGFAVGSLGLFSASDKLAALQPMPSRPLASTPVLAKSFTSEYASLQLQTSSDFLPPPPPPPPPPQGEFAVGSLGLFSAPQQPMSLDATESKPLLASASDAFPQPLPLVAADSVPVPPVSSQRPTPLARMSKRAFRGSAQRSCDSMSMPMSATGLHAERDSPCEDGASDSQPKEALGRRSKIEERFALLGSPVVPFSGRQTPREVKLHPELPLTIGIGTLGVIMTPVFTRGMRLPARHVIYLTTCFDYQASVRVKVYRGEHGLTAHNTLLGELELTGFESKQKGKTKIKAVFHIDKRGPMRVRITSEDIGCSNVMTIQAIEGDWSAEDIEAIIRSTTETEPVEQMDLRTMKASADPWDVCLYDEGQSDLTEDNSQKNLNISTGKMIWTEEKWSKLLSLHHKCDLESDGVFWDLDDELGSLICVDTKKLNEILVENGLKSLGNQAASDVRRLLANFLVLFSSCHYHFLLDNSQLKISRSQTTPGMKYVDIRDEFMILLVNASRYFQKTDKKHPLIYSRLNLGRSWAEAVSNLLGAGLPRNLTSLG